MKVEKIVEELLTIIATQEAEINDLKNTIVKMAKGMEVK